MLSKIASTLLPACTGQLVQRAGYRNLVMSDILARLDRACEQFTPPRTPPQKVTVIGAGSDIGRIACLFLKQQPLIRTLAMYDEHPCRGVVGICHDLAHIDTCTAVEAYQGQGTLKQALDNTDVVLICGGAYPVPPCCCMLDRELFQHNMLFVHAAVLAVANFCPHAVLCIQTPPVDCNFALAKYALMKCGVYDRCRLLGVNAINSMRANQLYCSLCDLNPAKNFVPVICGTGRCTRVPIFSAAGSFAKFPKGEIPCLTRLVREADELICRVKCNYEQGHLSIGFSTARFVTSVMKGLFERPQFIDSALVEQCEPEKSYCMPICATPVVVGRGGIVEYQIPSLDECERQLLIDSRVDLEDMLNLGKCQATGETYELHPCKCPTWCCEDCPVCMPCGAVAKSK